MSDSSDSEVNIEIPYSKRPEWADIKPIEQDIETNDIVRIAYTDNFKEVFDYFRAILKLNEKSIRAFELNKDAALLNPANYTVWYYRRILIKELNLDLNEELDFITNVINSHPKNYQVWQHRRNIVEYLQDASKELAFTQQILKKDSKNYHAWQYRQWAIKKFNLWTNELDYINSLLDADIRNNSAWNQRYFYISNRNNLNKPESIGVINEEIEFTFKKIQSCVDNESSWNYLRGLINHLNSNNEAISLNYPTNVIEFCISKVNGKKDYEKSPYLVSFLVDYNLIKARELMKKLEKLQNEEKISELDSIKFELCDLLKLTIDMLNLLATKYDTIRVNYWNYLSAKAKKEFANYV